MNLLNKAIFTLLLSSIFLHVNAQHSEAAQKLQTFYRYLELAYVDEVNEDQLVEDAIEAMLSDLDPHSTYFSAEELERANEPLQGNFEGIGIQFNIHKDTIVVVSPISGGPSEKLGIRSGDKIIAINDSVVAGVGFTNQDVADNLRGPKGSKVNVSIKRNGVKNLLDFEITRDKIPIYSVDAHYMVKDGIGYIKLNRFAATSMGEIYAAMDTLQNNGMTSLILDLRGNGGGYLNTATELADMFLTKDQMIVYTEGRAYPRSEMIAKKGGRFEKGKLVILVDEGSASASEIVSGAVQDWDRGLIIGRRTFGKGLVQKPFSLPDGSAIRLTVSRYYTPSGRCIQRPYDQGDDAYYEEFTRRYEHGEYTSKDSIDLPDSLKYLTLQSKRTVYGGGGIMPDIFVPLDTTQGSEYYTKLVRKGILNDFTLEYLDKNRSSIKGDYPTISDFVAQYEVSENLLNELYTFAEEQKVEKDDEGITTSIDLITGSLKGLIARGLYQNGAYYQVINQTDEAMSKAIQAIENDTFKALKIDYK
ncbi:MAG: peptidase S41 [Crocinitomicaceae bacterium]|nr:peptidase S41 [Crocinitomicaceae bacterium]|tara:strand:- start:2749 stop:4341 length:1593 start_codon:yes stop_codon:yes gene_type:complete